MTNRTLLGLDRGQVAICSRPVHAVGGSKELARNGDDLRIGRMIHRFDPPHSLCKHRIEVGDMTCELGSRRSRSNDNDPAEPAELARDLVEELLVRRRLAEVDVIGAPVDVQRRVLVMDDDLVDVVHGDTEDLGFAMIDPNAAILVRHFWIP